MQENVFWIPEANSEKVVLVHIVMFNLGILLKVLNLDCPLFWVLYEAF